jgi:phenylalanyl-tRNA synthetase beta chain
VLRNQRVFDLLGLEIDEKFSEKTLSRLGFQVELKREGLWSIQVPSYRVDVEREADLIEEIARFYGYDKIPVHFPPLRVPEPPLDKKREKIESSRQLLLCHGFDEVLNYSFSYPEKDADFETGHSAVEIRNPFSSKASHLRTTLLGGLLDNVVWNKNRGADGVHLFEIGNIYFRGRTKSHEQRTLSLVTTGQVGSPQWNKKSEKTDFFRLKGALEALMAYLKYDHFSFKEEDYTFFREKNSLVLVPYSLDEPVWAAELNLDALFEKTPQAFQYSPVTRFPTVIRDVSFIADQDVSFQDIREAVAKLSFHQLASFDIHDRFSGSSIPKGKVSLSIRFVFCHQKRTLKTEEVDKLQQKIIDTLGASFNFQLREGGKIDK